MLVLFLKMAKIRDIEKRNYFIATISYALNNYQTLEKVCHC